MKSELTFDMITETVRTIAHLMDVSLQMLDDVGYIRSYIENRMTYGLKLKEEAQLLTGSGTGQNLEGIYTAATAYSQPSGIVVVDEQDLDKLRPLLQVELAEAFATGIVLHPTDWAGIELLKDANHQYLFTNPQNTTTGRIWGRDVVSTQTMSQGTFRSVTSRSTRNPRPAGCQRRHLVREQGQLRAEHGHAARRGTPRAGDLPPEAFVKGVLSRPANWSTHATGGRLRPPFLLPECDMSKVKVVAVEPFNGNNVGAVVEVSEREAAQLVQKRLAKMQAPHSNKMRAASENKAVPSKAAGEAQRSSASRAAQASPQTTAKPSPTGARRGRRGRPPVIAVNNSWQRAPFADALFAMDRKWWLEYAGRISGDFEFWTSSRSAAAVWKLNLVNSEPGAG